MINDYEQMLLNDKAALETKITNLVEKKLNNNNEVDLELDLDSGDFYIKIQL